MPFYPKTGASSGGGGGTGTVTGGASEGTGTAVFDSSTSTASTLKFKSLAAGSNITVTDNGSGTLTLAASGSGGGGVTTVGTFSGSSETNGAAISTSTITFGPADITNPGMVTTGSQTLTGAKTFQASSGDASDFVTIQPAQQSQLLIEGTSNTNEVLVEVNSTGGGVSEYSGYIFSTSAGAHVAGISVSGPNATSGGVSYPVNQQRFTSSLLNGMRFLTADNTTNTKFDWWTVNGSGAGSRMSINGTGAVTVIGSATNSDNMILDPGKSGGSFLTMTKASGQLAQTMTNNAASGFTTIFLYNDMGTFAALQNTGSTAGFSIASGDQTQLFGEGANGVLVWAQQGPLALASKAVNGILVTLKANGNINMKLATYLSDSAAGTAGLVTGDLYLLTATNAVTSKT